MKPLLCLLFAFAALTGAILFGAVCVSWFVERLKIPLDVVFLAGAALILAGTACFVSAAFR